MNKISVHANLCSMEMWVDLKYYNLEIAEKLFLRILSAKSMRKVELMPKFHTLRNAVQT